MTTFNTRNNLVEGNEECKFNFLIWIEKLTKEGVVDVKLTNSTLYGKSEISVFYSKN